MSKPKTNPIEQLELSLSRAQQLVKYLEAQPTVRVQQEILRSLAYSISDAQKKLHESKIQHNKDIEQIRFQAIYNKSPFQTN